MASRYTIDILLLLHYSPQRRITIVKSIMGKADHDAYSKIRYYLTRLCDTGLIELDKSRWLYNNKMGRYSNKYLETRSGRLRITELGEKYLKMALIINKKINLANGQQKITSNKRLKNRENNHEL